MNMEILRFMCAENRREAVEISHRKARATVVRCAVTRRRLRAELLAIRSANGRRVCRIFREHPTDDCVAPFERAARLVGVHPGEVLDAVGAAEVGEQQPRPFGRRKTEQSHDFIGANEILGLPQRAAAIVAARRSWPK